MSTVHWLDTGDFAFPPTDLALTDPNGLLAVGGDLQPERLIAAYRQGIFPWYEYPQPILWWSPSPRAVLFPQNIHISRSLGKTLRRGTFTVTGDRAFREVMVNCAKTPRRGQDGTWITEEMLDAYCELHRRGYAHSVEAWQEDTLVGGLYGVAIGRVFFGESMFSKATDASKVAFVHLAGQLQQWGFPMIDCQVTNPHLLSLGAEEIDRELFTRLLAENVDKVNPHHWPDSWERMSGNRYLRADASEQIGEF